VRIFITIAFSIFLLFSCQKEKLENKLMHRWKYVSVTKPVIFQPTTYWTFNKSSVFVIDSATTDTVLYGNYFLKNSFMIISGANSAMSGGELFKGNFQVLQLNDSIMILVRNEGGGLIYYEFIKAN
jgi:hypothetical protein